MFRILSLFCLVFIAPAVALGCSCRFEDPPAAFNRADAIFIGQMLGGSETFSTLLTQDRTSLELEAGRVRFAVTEVFKGKTPATGEIAINMPSMRGTSCGDYGLKRGLIYLVYAYRNPQDKEFLYSGVCTRTGSVESEGTKADLAFLKNLPAAGSGGTIRGRIWLDVKKVEGGSAEVISGVTVGIRDRYGKEITTVTDANGEFTVSKLKAGKYRVEPRLPKHYYIDEPFEDVQISDLGTADVGFEAYFNGYVSGRMIDINGAEYNDAILHLRSVDDKDERWIIGHSEGKNGVFRFDGVPAGNYIISLELQHEDPGRERIYYYPGTYTRADAKSVKVDLGKEVSGLTFKLPSEYLIKTIEGQVFWKDGSSASGVDLLLLCPQSTTPDGYAVESSPPSVETTKSGRFTIQVFAGETYWLQARGKRGKAQFQSIPRRISVKDNLRNVKVILSKPGQAGSCGEATK